MATDLIVRNLDEDIILALNVRAALHGRSAESEHREILRSALQKPKRLSFAEVLTAMPSVGLDADFDARSNQG
jgi:plasmid stability protein